VAFDNAGRAARNATVSNTAMVAMKLVNFFICTFPFASDWRLGQPDLEFDPQNQTRPATNC
jgi:hypothetical protein